MNKNTKVLALKYRPQTFDDLIGQEVVAETIINSIRIDKVPNATLLVQFIQTQATSFLSISVVESLGRISLSLPKDTWRAILKLFKETIHRVRSYFQELTKI